MNLLDTINKAQTLSDLEKGEFQGNQHIAGAVSAARKATTASVKAHASQAPVDHAEACAAHLKAADKHGKVGNLLEAQAHSASARGHERQA